MELTFLAGLTRHCVALPWVVLMLLAPLSAQVDWNESLGHGIQGRALDAEDADGDGDSDLLLAAHDTGDGAIYLAGDGGATWTDQTTPNLPGWPTFSDAFLRDFDGDGDADAFFLSAIDEGIHFSRFTHGWEKSFAISPAMLYSTLDFAKVHGDSTLAVAASPPGAEGIDLFRWNGSGWDRSVVDTDGVSAQWLAAGDFQKDGFDDFVGVDGSGGLFLVRFKGGSWVLERDGLPQDLLITKFWARDLDGDGYTDLFGLGKNGGLVVLMNRTPNPWEEVLFQTAFEYRWLSVADADRDGLPDILATTDDALHILWGQAVDKWFDPVETILPNDANVFTRATFEYLDVDDWVDLVAIESNKFVRLFTNRDGSPPAGWWDFTPGGWIASALPLCSVRVEDNVDLSISSAVYQYSTDGGGSWSAAAAVDDVVVEDERHATLSVTVAAFNTTSDLFRVRFQIEDLAGNVGQSPDYPVRIDMIPPELPSLLYTFRHEEGAWGPWSRVNQIRYSWPVGEDDLSGVAGYSVLIDRNPAGVPDGLIEFGPGVSDRLQTTEALGDGMDWYLHLRTVDRAGNASAGTLTRGPFFLDTHRPSPPTIRINGSGSWPDWFSSHQTIEIRRGADGGSEALGIRYLITRDAASDPSTGVLVEGPVYQQSTNSLDMTQPWYAHAVTVDRAGNVSDVAHSAPIRVDVDPPGGLIFATPDDETGSRVRVQVFHIIDRGAGIDYWQLFFRQAGTSAWTEYGIFHNDAPEQTVFFTPPDVNIEYEVAARFRDRVGHESTMTSPRSTRFERDLTVNTRVETVHEMGPPTFEALSGVKVYHNDDYVGETNGSGAIRLADVYIGDRITALHKVFTRDSNRRERELLGGSPWAYNVYLTNVTIEDDGTSSGHIVQSMAGPMTLQLRRENALVGFHLVMSTSWNADHVYWSAMRQRMEMASDYLYNVSDGQMFLELVELYENRALWDDGADGRIHFRDYRANASVNGLYSRYSYKNMEFGAISNHRVYIHEMGHYALNLYDEYITHSSDDLWYCDDANCTLQRLDEESPFAAHGPLSACVMDNQGSAFNFCDDGTGNAHNHETAQHRYRGEPCWETIESQFRDRMRPDPLRRWLIRRPNDRGGHVPGPDALPCDAWDRVHIFDTPGAGGYGGVFRLLKATGDPWDRVAVSIEHSDGTTMKMGSTDRQGYVTLHNIYPPDRAIAYEYLEGVDDPILHFFDLPDSSSGSRILTESARRNQLADSGPRQTPPYVVALDVSPGTTVTLLRISLTASEELSESPRATIRTEQGDGWVRCLDLTWNESASAYTGQVELLDMDEPSGSISVETVDWEGNELTVGTEFHFVHFAEDTELIAWGASGSDLRLFGDAGAIPAGTIIHISQVGRPEPDGLRIVKGPYRIASMNGGSFAGNVGVMITYGSATDPIHEVDPATLGLRKWNDTTLEWDALTSHHIEERGEVSAPMTDYGIFALVGAEAPPDPMGWMLR